MYYESGEYISTVLEYKGYYQPLDSVPDDVIAEWETTLKAERARILSALQEKISNATEFINKLANPAYQQWQNFINPEWADADFIKLKYQVKLKTAYGSWSTGIQNAFAEGGTFETNVTAKKDKLQKLRYVLGAVGLKHKIGWGPAYKAMAIVTGDHRISLYFGPDDSFTGNIVNAFPSNIVKFVRPVGIAILTQGLVIAQYAHEQGLASERDAVITAINSKLDNSVEKLIDTSAYSALDIGIEYDSIADKLAVHVTLSSV